MLRTGLILTGMQCRGHVGKDDSCVEFSSSILILGCSWDQLLGLHPTSVEWQYLRALFFHTHMHSSRWTNTIPMAGAAPASLLHMPPSMLSSSFSISDGGHGVKSVVLHAGMSSGCPWFPRPVHISDVVTTGIQFHNCAFLRIAGMVFSRTL